MLNRLLSCVLSISTLSFAQDSSTIAYQKSSIANYNQEQYKIDSDEFYKTIVTSNKGSIAKTSCFHKSTPIYSCLAAGYSSDKLAIAPYKEYFSIGKQETWSRLAAQLIRQSFDIAGNSAEETSQKITEKIKGGASLFGQMSFAPLTFVSGDIFVMLQSSMNFKADLPEAPFLLIFSEENGLRRGNELPLTHMGLQMCVTTDINGLYRHSTELKGLTSVLQRFTGKKLFENANIINGLTVSLGNALVDISAIKGGIHLNSEGTEMYADTKFKIRGSGVSFRNDNGINIATGEGFPVSGIGAGLNSGIVISGQNTILSMGMQNVGPMVWKHMRETEISLRTANIMIAELLEKNYDLFDQNRGGYVSEIDTGDILHTTSSDVCWLPATFLLSFQHRFIQKKKVKKWFVPEYVIPALFYENPLTSWPGRSPKSGIVVTNEIGFIQGWVPVGFGWSYGYGRKGSSFISTGMNSKRFSCQLGYEAIGTPYLYPKRGCTISLRVVSGN
jgi:hypothetical protein